MTDAPRLEWLALPTGQEHAVPAGLSTALCNITGHGARSDWQQRPRRARCTRCERYAAWPVEQLAGRIASLPVLPPTRAAGPRERYLHERGLIP